MLARSTSMRAPAAQRASVHTMWWGGQQLERRQMLLALGCPCASIVSQGSTVIRGSDKSADVEEEGLIRALPSRKKRHRKTRGLQHALQLQQDATCQQV